MFIEGEIPNVVTTNGGGSNGGFGYGGDWAWIIIILFALWGGNGRGFGGYGGGSGGADNYVLATDFATIERKIDGVNNGLCDGFYATAQQINGVQQTLCQGFSGVNSTITTNGYETRNAITDLGYRLQDCCCATQRAIDGVNYNMATSICNSTRDIIENANANYRAIHDEIIANKIEAKNEKIAEQQAQITALQLRASQEAQNNFLLSELKPCPKPAYITCNPYATYPAYGAGNACGCGSVL